MATETPAGWYPAPEAPDLVRYWDGEMWTDKARPAPGAVAGSGRGPGAGAPREITQAEVVVTALGPGERVEAGFAAVAPLRHGYFVATATRVLVIDPSGVRKHKIHSYGYDEIESIELVSTGVILNVWGAQHAGTNPTASTMQDFVEYVEYRKAQPGPEALESLPRPNPLPTDHPTSNALQTDALQSDFLRSNAFVSLPASAVDTPNKPSVADELLELAHLHADGLLSDEQFLAAKADLIGR